MSQEDLEDNQTDSGVINPGVGDTTSTTSVVLADETLLNELDHEVDIGIVRDYKSSQTQNSLEGIRPFQIRRFKEDTYVGLPSNIKQLMQKYYLFKMFYLCCRHRRIKFVRTDVSVHSKLNEGANTYLHGFCSIIANKGEIAEYQDIWRGPYKSGLFAAMRIIHSESYDWDINLFKYVNANSPVTDLFGDVWGTQYKAEKSCLDFIIIVLKDVTKGKHINTISYLKSLQEVKKVYGLTLSKLENNKLMTPEERDILFRRYEKVIEACKQVKLPQTQTLLDYGAWEEDLKIMKRALRPMKNLINDIVNARAKIIFVVEKGQKKPNKKAPIESLINNKKGTIDYINAFNPCRIIGLPISFRVGSIPLNDPELDTAINQLKAYLLKSGIQVDTTEYTFVLNWYAAELSRFRY